MSPASTAHRRRQVRVVSLSWRQGEIIRLAVQGLKSTEIAEELGWSVRTIDGDIDLIKAALDLRTLAQITVFAHAWGLVEVELPEGVSVSVSPPEE